MLRNILEILSGALLSVSRQLDITIGYIVDVYPLLLPLNRLRGPAVADLVSKTFDRLESLFQTLCVSSYVAAAGCYVEAVKNKDASVAFQGYIGLAFFYVLGVLLGWSLVCLVRQRILVTRRFL